MATHYIASTNAAIKLKCMQYPLTPTWWQARNIHLKWQLLSRHDHAVPGTQQITKILLGNIACNKKKAEINLRVYSPVLVRRGLSWGEHMLSSRPNCLQLSLKIEESNESSSDVVGLFTSKCGSSVFWEFSLVTMTEPWALLKPHAYI